MTDDEKARVLYWLENSSSPDDIEENIPVKELQPFLSIPNKEEYKITSNQDSYVYSRFDPKLSENIELSHVDFFESNPSIVNHRTIFIDTTGIILIEEKSQKEYDEVLKKLTPFFAWSKGMIPCKLTDDFYYKVPVNAKFTSDLLSR